MVNQRKAIKNNNNNNIQQNIDELLNSLGNIGKYQTVIYLLSILPVFIAGMLSSSFVFTTAVPEYRCLILECDTIDNNNNSSIDLNHGKHEALSQSLFADSFISFTIPLKHKHDDIFDNCFQYDSDFNHLNPDKDIEKCVPKFFNNKSIKQCDEYKFNDEYFQTTIVTDYNLYCHYEWIIQLMQSLFFFGVLIGAIVNGIIADKFGRRIIFIIYSPVTFLGILLSLLSPNLSFYTISLFIKGICVAGIYQSAFTIGIECLGGKWRFWLGNSYSLIFASGAIYATLCAWYLRQWRFIELSNLVPALFMLPYPFILNESLRWQFSSGKIHKALKQIQIAANKNNVILSNDLIESILHKASTHASNSASIESNNNDDDDDDDEYDVSIYDIFKHKLIRKWTITFLYIWFTNALVYYGLSFLAQDIHKNIYLSMVLLMIVEFPGVFLVAYIGDYTRKYVLMGIMIIGGCSCIASSFLSEGQFKMWLIILGKMSISGSFSLIYVYTAEIFPTVLRITGLGMCSFCSRFGAMIAPYLLRLHLFGNSFPFFIIGIVTLIAGLVSMILPETKGKRLPDTLDEVEQLKYTNKQLQSLKNNQNNDDEDEDDDDDNEIHNETDNLLQNQRR